VAAVGQELASVTRGALKDEDYVRTSASKSGASGGGAKRNKVMKAIKVIRVIEGIRAIGVGRVIGASRAIEVIRAIGVCRVIGVIKAIGVIGVRRVVKAIKAAVGGIRVIKVTRATKGVEGVRERVGAVEVMTAISDHRVASPIGNVGISAAFTSFLHRDHIILYMA